MSYSEIVEEVNKKGFEDTAKRIYRDYVKARKAYEVAKQALESAESKRDVFSSQSANLVRHAVQQGLTLEEDGSHVIRIIIDDEVVHFRTKDGNHFIGHYLLSNFNKP